MHDDHDKSLSWLSPRGIAAIALIAGVIYFLLTEHRAHFISALPFLILLLCPILHLFMHGNHGGQHHGAGHHPVDQRREKRP